MPFSARNLVSSHGNDPYARKSPQGRFTGSKWVITSMDRACQIRSVGASVKRAMLIAMNAFHATAKAHSHGLNIPSNLPEYS